MWTKLGMFLNRKTGSIWPTNEKAFWLLRPHALKWKKKKIIIKQIVCLWNSTANRHMVLTHSRLKFFHSKVSFHCNSCKDAGTNENAASRLQKRFPHVQYHLQRIHKCFEFASSQQSWISVSGFCVFTRKGQLTGGRFLWQPGSVILVRRDRALHAARPCHPRVVLAPGLLRWTAFVVFVWLPFPVHVTVPTKPTTRKRALGWHLWNSNAEEFKSHRCATAHLSSSGGLLPKWLWWLGL